MAPGTWNAPGENYTVAAASGVAWPQIMPKRSESGSA